MRYSIITPTLQRESLIKTCESVNGQTYKDWEHIVMVDCEEMKQSVLDRIEHENRLVVKCPKAHKNYGNTCRHNAWNYATGEYLIYTDDDNWLADERVLEDLSQVTADWALFPILRHGQWFYNNPPKACYVDTANVIVKREIGRWPDIPNYEADGHLIESLMKYPYLAMPQLRPMVVMPASRHGE